MNAQALILPLAAALGGGLIGAAFGIIQENARRKYQSSEDRGTFKSGWSVTPGSLRRVAYLLAILALLQLGAPVFFSSGPLTMWCLSGGIALGYGATLLRLLRQRLS
jgi:hypothetical protein